MSVAPRATVLNAGIAASALLAIAGAPWALGQSWMVFVFKPLATLLIIALAWPRGRATPLLRRLVLAGLLLSLAGDVALLWPKEGFLPGLIAFLIAHLLYIAAFTRVQRFAAHPVALLVYALLAGVILSQLWAAVPPALHLPVAAYVLALASMAAQAAVVWWGARGTAEEPRARILAIGGALFLCSDALLATNKFAIPLPMASLWILATYWAAQWCISSWLHPSTGATSP